MSCTVMSFSVAVSAGTSREADSSRSGTSMHLLSTMCKLVEEQPVPAAQLVLALLERAPERVCASGRARARPTVALHGLPHR